MESVRWHTLSVSQVFGKLQSLESGISQEEALKRRERFGLNKLPEAVPETWLAIFLSQFLSPLIYVLLAAAVVVFLMGEYGDGLIIFAVLIFNAIVGAIQEGKAQNTLQALKNFIETNAAVLRDGRIMIIPDAELVPGDILILQEGDKVAADARLIQVSNLKIDESALTGESFTVSKNILELQSQFLPAQEQRNMVFRGTHVATGSGRAVVVATGLGTEIGKISEKVALIDTEVPLKSAIRRLSELLLFAVGIMSVGLFILGLLRGEPLTAMFATVVSLAVSVIPEGLPIVLTLVLATGVWRLAERHVLVKKLQAVEALGHATLIAVDKTGTLTKNEMTLRKFFIGGKVFEVEGSGYVPEGKILENGTELEPLDHKDVLLAGRVASFGSSAELLYSEESKNWHIVGDPTEAALRVFAERVGYKHDDPRSPKLEDIPFDYKAKYHLAVHKYQGGRFLTVTGAPEVILDLSDRVWEKGSSIKITEKKREVLEQAYLNFSKEGLRVVAVAIKARASQKIDSRSLPGLTFVSFFGLQDPLRENAKNAIEKIQQAGIRVVMITGDHAVTAKSISQEAGLIDRAHQEVLTGEDLRNLSEVELIQKAVKCNVFARVTPEDKLKIIELFRRQGHVVSMTGDGVNDAPSLAAADLGVSMGKIGTEVAKAASDIVLLDDSLENVVTAISEGRLMYEKVKRVILYLFSTSLGEVFAITGALLIGLPLPVLPSQIIWLNFVTDGFLTVALAMEEGESSTPKKALRKARNLLNAKSIRRMFYMGITISIGTLFAFSYYLNEAPERALTVSLTVLAVFQWLNAWNVRSELESVFNMPPQKNMYLIGAMGIVIVLQLLAVYVPFMQNFLTTVPLSGEDWGFVLAMASLIILVEEVRKLILRNWTDLTDRIGGEH